VAVLARIAAARQRRHAPLLVVELFERVVERLGLRPHARLRGDHLDRRRLPAASEVARSDEDGRATGRLADARTAV
jgi:hypothetical protein